MLVVVGIGLQDFAKVRFAQDHDMVQALSSDRADQPLDVAILPGRPRCRWSVPNTHGREASRYDVTIGGVPVADEVSGRVIPGEGLGDLTGDPFGRGVIGHAQRDQASSFMPQDDQDKQQPKIDRRDHQEVHGTDPSRMIAQERLPCFGPTLQAAAWPYIWRPSTVRLRSQA